MKARDQVRLDTLRSVLSAFTYKRVEAGHDLTDDEQLAIVQKLVKQRSDSIAEFDKAGRTELVDEGDARARDPPALPAGAEVGRRGPRDRPRGARRAPGRGAQSGRRDEGRHAAAQGPGRRQPRPPDRHRGTRCARNLPPAQRGRASVRWRSGLSRWRCIALGLVLAAARALRRPAGDGRRRSRSTGRSTQGMAHLVERACARREPASTRARSSSTSTPSAVWSTPRPRSATPLLHAGGSGRSRTSRAGRGRPARSSRSSADAHRDGARPRRSAPPNRSRRP